MAEVLIFYAQRGSLNPAQLGHLRNARDQGSA